MKIDIIKILVTGAIVSMSLSSCAHEIRKTEITTASDSLPEIQASEQSNQDVLTLENVDSLSEYDNSNSNENDSSDSIGAADETLSDVESAADNNPSYMDTSNIETKITEICTPIAEGGGIYSVEVISLDGSIIFSIGNEEDPSMVSASLIKLYVAGTVYDNIDDMRSLELYEGETDYLLSLMISKSDNESCNTLVTRLGSGDAKIGMDMVNSFCSDHGYHDTKMNRLMLDFNGLENYTSVNDCTEILKAYYNDDLKGSSDIIKYMKNQATRTKIPSGIPGEIVVANKTGELANVENDTAIVYASSGDYIISVMTNNLSDTSLARSVISEISEEVYDYMCL